jgi:hypothetical protein
MPTGEFNDEQLVERIGELEDEIESIKVRLMDNSKIEELTRRIAQCESLAGIKDEKDQDVKFE